MERTSDLIDAARAQWAEVHPDVDTSTMDVVGRVLRAAALLRHRLDATFAADPPAAIVTGAERWTSGDPALDEVLDRWAAGHRYRAVAAGRSVLWVRPAITAR